MTRALRPFPRLRRPRLLLLPLLLAGACAFGPGEPFAVLEPSLKAALVVAPGRDAGDGWHTLASGYQVSFTAARLETGAIALLDTGAPAALSFDPAKPPPGYSLCHNGHCHKDDGSLPSYADIEAELSGTAPADRVVVALPLGAVELLPGQDGPLECEPSCELEQAHLRRARLPVRRVVLEGRVRDRRGEPKLTGEVPFRMDAASPGDAPLFTLAGELDLPADRTAPPLARLRIELGLTARILDDVDFAALAQDAGSFDLDAPDNHQARERVLRELAETPLTATIARSALNH